MFWSSGTATQKSPSVANNLVRYLSAMISWGIPRRWHTNNPCNHVKKLKIGDGYSPWTRREIAHFRKHARTDLWHAVALALYSGQRQGDVLEMRRSDIVDGVLRVKQNKTGKLQYVPMHADLRAIIAEMPRNSVYLLTNSNGQPWSVDGFKTAWQREMDRRIFAPLRRRRRTFHGLRKSSVVFLLEAGCSDGEVCSVTGQSRQMLEHYSREVNQLKLARAAVLKWERADGRTKNERRP